MTETTLILLAASTAAAMVFLVRAGVSPSLRAVSRTSLVLGLGWLLAYRAQHGFDWSSVSWRISAAQVMEITPEELFEAYTKKHRVNLGRQESGYKTKDESDNKLI